MRGQYQGAGLGGMVQRPVARGCGGLRKLAIGRVPVWPGNLEGMMQHIAPEQGVFAFGDVVSSEPAKLSGVTAIVGGVGDIVRSSP